MDNLEFFYDLDINTVVTSDGTPVFDLFKYVPVEIYDYFLETREAIRYENPELNAIVNVYFPSHLEDGYYCY